ncbi:MAG: hypothetical protein JWO39_344 [Gemmatimonadetes bacterium]|jgi:hypothetical protein|nr:hypothetical protein [Gemmatimonadota bacterium]
MSVLMPVLIGIALALAVSAYARWIGFDRDRAFYPTLLIVIAFYYVLFSVMGGIARTTLVEISIMTIFLVSASVGFRRNLWLVVAGLVAHAIFDVFHGSVVSNLGMPAWWPAFCSTYDFTAAGVLALTLLRSPALTKPRGATAP